MRPPPLRLPNATREPLNTAWSPIAIRRGLLCLTIARFRINGHPDGHRQLDLIEVAAGLRAVVEFLLELERTVTDGVEDRCDHLQMRSRILQLP